MQQNTQTQSQTKSTIKERWRLAIGNPNQVNSDLASEIKLSPEQEKIDQLLTALYESNKVIDGKKTKGSLSGSNPNIARWLGDIKKYFPQKVVQIMQRDALERLDLKQMLLEPELLQAATPDVHLVANIISLSSVIPEKTKETARELVQKIVDQLIEKLREPVREAVNGAIDKSVRNPRPRYKEINWDKTIKANLRHYQQDKKIIIPEKLIGWGRKSTGVKQDVILCIDQSGSMGESVVYSSIFAATLAMLPAIKTRLIAFDTSIIDLSEKINDPVDVLFGVQLGGGTDINGAIKYCQSQIQNPQNTILVLISDLYEGGIEAELIQRAKQLINSGVQFITLLALTDSGKPSYDANIAQQLANIGVPSFACTPDIFPDMMAAAIKRQDINQWAGERELTATRKTTP